MTLLYPSSVSNLPRGARRIQLQLVLSSRTPAATVRPTSLPRRAIRNQRCLPLQATNISKQLLEQIEELKQQADALQSELQEAGRIAEVAAKRSRRLAERSHELQEYAFEHVSIGDEAAARAALLQKASVADALTSASRRAEANSALARKLEQLLLVKQAQLLELLRQAKEQVGLADAVAAKPAQPEIGTGPPVQQERMNASSKGLRRSRSVAWSSATMHASSDGMDEAQQPHWQQLLLCEDASQSGVSVDEDPVAARQGLAAQQQLGGVQNCTAGQQHDSTASVSVGFRRGEDASAAHHVQQEKQQP